MRTMQNILWGLVLIILGLVFGLNSLGITDINLFFKGWWTLFIIIPCGIGLLKNSNRFGNIIGLIIGIVLLLSSQGFLDFDTIYKLIVPFILVALGLSLLFKETINTKINEKIKTLNKDGLREHAAVFAGEKINIQNENLEGLSLTAVFGGLELDVVNAIIEKDVIINTTAIFGGIDVRVPQNINVKVKSTSIFGGVSNNTRLAKNENMPTIYINAFCMFGGVEIK